MSIPLQGGCCHPPAFLLDDNPTDPYGQSSGSIMTRVHAGVGRNIRNAVGRKTVNGLKNVHSPQPFDFAQDKSAVHR